MWRSPGLQSRRMEQVPALLAMRLLWVRMTPAYTCVQGRKRLLSCMERHGQGKTWLTRADLKKCNILQYMCACM